jgi:hypothetical protein
MQDLWSRETQENKGQEIDDFCGAANMCGSERKSEGVTSDWAEAERKRICK